MISEAAQLRMLIANEELRRRELQILAESMLDGTTALMPHGCGLLFTYRARLADLLSTAPHTTEAALAGASGQPRAAQSETT